MEKTVWMVPQRNPIPVPAEKPKKDDFLLQCVGGVLALAAVALLIVLPYVFFGLLIIGAAICFEEKR